MKVKWRNYVCWEGINSNSTFYNGTSDIGEGYTQRISDAFYKDFHLDTNHDDNVSLEVVVKVSKNAKKAYAPGQIAEQLEENVELVEKICKLAQESTPQYDEKYILNNIMGQAK